LRPFITRRSSGVDISLLATAVPFAETTGRVMRPIADCVNVEVASPVVKTKAATIVNSLKLFR
jgi:hypothetical protein